MSKEKVAYVGNDNSYQTAHTDSLTRVFTVRTNNNFITKTRLFKYILKFSPPKTEFFSVKISDILYISDQNIECGYSLELPRQQSTCM